MTSKAAWGGLGAVAALRLCVRGHSGGGEGGEMATGSVTGSHASGTCKRGKEKRHKSVLQRNRPDHSWKEGKPLNQVLEIQAAGS